MSAKTLLVNEGMLQEMEKRLAEIRSKGGELVRAMNGKVSFSDGVMLSNDYSVAVEILQDLCKQLFGVMDLVDPEDNELLRREEQDVDDDEEESEDEDDEDGEEGDDE